MLNFYLKTKLTLFLSFTICFGYAQNLEPYSSTEYTISSKHLKEEQTGTVYQPSEATDSLVTFYVLDGNWHFEYIKSTIDLYRRWNRIPNVRIVSIHHTNRTSDLTPTEDAQRFPSSGNASNFLNYLENELQPYTNQKFGKSSQNILFGHSFGGLFAIYTLGTKPKLFDGYIAASPSTWWKDDYLFGLNYNEAVSELTNKPFVFMTSGEFDSGETKSSNQLFVEKIINDTLRQKIEFSYQLNKGENHFTNITISFQQALNSYFLGAEVEQEATEIYQKYNLVGLKKWNETTKNKYGVRFIFPEETILKMAADQIRNKKSTEAIGLLEWIIANSTESGNANYYLGYSLAQKGERLPAIKAYKKALTTDLPERVKAVIRKSIEDLTPNENAVSQKILSQLISTEGIESSIAINPTYDTLFFVRNTGKWAAQDNPPSTIYFSYKKNNAWSEPKIAWFSEENSNDTDVFISPNGASIFFVSNRNYNGKIGSSADIWEVKMINGKWSKPSPLPYPINSDGMEASPTTNTKGDLYFVSMRKEGKGQGDIYVSKYLGNDQYEAPQIIEPASTKYGEWNVLVSQQDDWIVFESSGRPEGKSSFGDLYISKKENNTWQAAIPLTILNTTGSELNARLSPDGKTLIYASSQFMENSTVDLFEIDFELIFSK